MTALWILACWLALNVLAAWLMYRRGVYLLYPGSPKPWVAKYRRREIGAFATEDEARAARAAAIAEDPDGANLHKPGKKNAGRSLSDDHKKKLGEAQKGRQHTEETKKRMSASIKAALALRKEKSPQ